MKDKKITIRVTETGREELKKIADERAKDGISDLLLTPFKKRIKLAEKK